jgi:hypothetical protein
MSRYDWPASGHGRRDDPAGRAAFLRSVRGPVDAEVIENAIRHRRAVLARFRAMRAPDVTVDYPWLPVGPATVVQGQAGGQPRVSGRARDVWVSDDGLRVYVATANGGVWYSDDAGLSWLPVGAWTGAIRGEVTSPLTCGCLHVVFGANPDGSDDDVLVGTGEIIPGYLAHPAGKHGGVGVLYAKGPAAAARDKPLDNPWKREANNLGRMGIYRLAVDPADPDRVVAATSHGLFSRAGEPVENADWAPVSAEPFNRAPEHPTDPASFACTDVAWTALDLPVGNRLWVAVREVGFTRDETPVEEGWLGKSGLWVSEHGVSGPFERVSLPDLVHDSRLAVTAATVDQRILYVLGRGPRLWRIAQGVEDVRDLRAHRVTGVPPGLFGDNDQSSYDMAIAVDPDNPDRIAFGGAGVKGLPRGGAALFRCAVTGLEPDYALDYLVDEPLDNPVGKQALIGGFVHADVHQIAWRRVGADSHMWIACDGGVFRSTSDGDNGSFVARNTGLASLECGFVAGHPGNDVAMITGTQDNGVLQRIGDTLWKTALTGDGGGLAYHPLEPHRFVGQYVRGSWRDELAREIPVVHGSGRDPEAQRIEMEHSAFYSNAAVSRDDPTLRLAIGTHRVWLSEDWGRTWRTLPCDGDPRATGQPSGWKADTPGVRLFDHEPRPGATVIALRWASPDRLLVLFQRMVYRFDCDTTGTLWTATVIDEKPKEKTWPASTEITTPAAHLMPKAVWSDLASHRPANAPHGSFYVATGGPPDGESVAEAPNADALWWFDGAGAWHATGLRTDPDGVPAPAYAVVVDPRAGHDFVYVGTAVGAWRGAFSEGTGGPEWAWEPFSNGLPETAVQDLSIHQDAAGRILLRAAVQARGVWEVDLADPAPRPLTFLRVHPYDSRRVMPIPLHDPTHDPATSVDATTWYASPDVRVRPAPGAPLPDIADLDLEWTYHKFGHDYHLWIFQTALHAIDPACPVETGDELWTPAFKDRVVARRVALGLTRPGDAVVDVDLWNAVVTAGTAYTDPWNGHPTEADLYELILDRKRSGIIDPFAPPPPPAAHLIPAGPVFVDVLVHHRHAMPAPKDDVFATLLYAELPIDDAQWPTFAVPWRDGAVELLRTGTAPAGWPPAPWQTVIEPLRRSPFKDVEAIAPRVVPFRTNLGAATPGSVWVFVAVVYARKDDPADRPYELVGDTLQDLVLLNPYVAGRIVEVTVGVEPP